MRHHRAVAKPRTPPETPTTRPFNDAFRGLAAAREALGVASAATPDEATPRAPAPAPARGRLAGQTGKLVLSRERKGHGGKTMTRVAGLALPEAALEDVAQRLKRALGCGAVVEDGVIWVQGDQTERAAAWLRGEGAPRVIVGN
jgi:translation initiation factor 1 (eIF-1/SUI1)